jgi:hypothetical protein
LRDKRLILVFNGASHNFERAHDIVVLNSERGPAQYMNAALGWLRENAPPTDWFAKCDSDDYYGPRYLESVADSEQFGADYSGCNSAYIKPMAGGLWFVNGHSDSMFHGPTLAARIGTALPFPHVDDWGEDELWSANMVRECRQPLVRAPEGFCYQRWTDNEHTWPCTDSELLRAWALPFSDLGAFNLRVVNGDIARPTGTPVGSPDTDINDFMAIRVLKEKIRCNSSKTP